MRTPSHEITSIRRAAQADAETISQVIVETLRQSNAADYAPHVIARLQSSFSPQAVARMIRERHVLIASRHGRIVGTAALDGASIRTVFVRPEEQRSGIGGCLMTEILLIAQSAGREALTLQSSLGAVGFYARLGFIASRDAIHGDERTVVMDWRRPA